MGEFQYKNAELACSSEWILPVVRDELRLLPAGSIVADLGCGNGSILADLREYRFELHGLDASRSGLAQAEKAYPDIQFSCADLMSDLSSHFLTERCDAVISTEVVEHVFLPRLFAANCYRMLKPGGRLVISTPYHGYVKNLALAITGKLESHFTVLWDYGHIKFWSKRTLYHLLGEAGFIVQHFHGVGRMPYLWKSMILVARKPDPPVGR
jgi:2-polyprenyl-6-hydroxyphenyl methylase/3-demethylubiquinone-9 3-methyltransferase